MARASVVVGAGLAWLLALAGAAGATEYTFRGIPLGIALDEFRRLPHPDNIAGAQVFCTGEVDRVSNVQLEVFGADATLGLKRCTYFTVAKDHSIPPFFFRQNVTVGAVHGPVAFLFYPDSERGGAYRLMAIAIGAESDRFEPAVSAYTERFGKPTSLAEGPRLETPAGRKFKNMVAVWDGAGTSIEVTQRFGAINHMEIQYFEKRLFARYATAREKLTGKPSDKL